MDPEKIGKFICSLRKEKNLSQYQLADMIPISRQGVSKWERGVTTPDTPTLIILSELFDVSIDELLRGERRETHTIKDLEETTLSILEQSNKKTKKIKRITLIFTIIITILLLLFLSYYFINSYNSIVVYKTIGNTDKFITLDGIFITTKEKYYLKLGKVKNKIDAEITNIKLFYKKDNKDIILVQDGDIDNITIMDSYGYGEKISKKDLENLKENLYIEITYNETEKEIIKLRFKRDYKNSSLFFINQKTGKKEVKKVEQEETKLTEEKKEEVKPTIQETETKKEELKQTPTQQKEETPQPEQPQEQPPQEPEITTEQIINKIKETCSLDIDSYVCGYDNYNIMIMYYENTDKIEFYESFNLVGSVMAKVGDTTCMMENCETKIDNIINNYLFS